MLERTSNSTEPGTGQPRRIVVERAARSIEGRALPQIRVRYRDPRDLARLAAEWVDGSLTIKHPTTTTAAALFGVCPQLVREELCKLELRPSAPPPIDTLWKSLPTIERNAFVRRHLISIWDSVDAVTR